MIRIRQSGVYIGVFIVLGISIFAAVISYTYVDKETIIREVTPGNQGDIDTIQNTQADLLEAINALITRVENSEGTQTELLEAARSLSARVENSEGTTNDLLEATDTLADRLGNTEESTVVEQAYQAVVGATVSINAEGRLGGGFIYDSNGHIITDAQLLIQSNIPDRSLSFVDIIINQNEGTARIVRGRVLGVDLTRSIGVVKIDPADGDFMTARLGLNSNVRVGQTVIAAGVNVFIKDRRIDAENRLTRGAVSGLNRRFPDDVNPAVQFASTLIQTDAFIGHHLNLGTPLVNLNGEVIGIIVLIQKIDKYEYGRDIGTNFALPIGEAKEAVDAIVAANPG